LNRNDVASFPLIGSIQNSVGMGFLGNQAVVAIANALGARVLHVPTMYATAHGGFTGRSASISEPNQFRRDVQFLVGQRPGIVVVGYLPKPNLVDIVATQLKDYKGVVLLDPVIGDYQKGLFVSEETARAIKEQLLPMAQLVTPNRFEAEVVVGAGGPQLLPCLRIQAVDEGAEIAEEHAIFGRAFALNRPHAESASNRRLSLE